MSTNHYSSSSSKPSMVDHTKSWLLGGMDHIIPFLFQPMIGSRVKKQNDDKPLKLFADGYGDMGKYYDRLNSLTTAMEERRLLAERPFKESDFEWTTKNPGNKEKEKKTQRDTNDDERPMKVEEAFFPSPAADILPPECAKGRFLLLQPASHPDNLKPNTDSSSGTPRTFIIILPGLGEAGKKERYALAKRFVEEKGWSSLIVTALFYGVRRPSYQPSCLLTLGEQFLQTLVIYEEAAMLAQYLLQLDPRNKVCITGFSFGGGCSLGAVSVALSFLDESSCNRLGGTFFCPTISYEDLVKNELGKEINYEAFRESEDEDLDETKRKLYQIMRDMKISNMTDTLWKANGGGDPPKIAAALHGAMRGDLLVQPTSSERFFEVVENRLPCHTKKKLRWFHGGHASAAIMRHVFQFSLVEETMQMMNDDELFETSQLQ